jgi:hypothetical protein
MHRLHGWVGFTYLSGFRSRAISWMVAARGTQAPPLNGKKASALHPRWWRRQNEEFRMKSTLIASAAALLLSASAAFAAGPGPVTVAAAPATGQAPAVTYSTNGTNGTSGYVYPDGGSAADQWAAPVQQPAFGTFGRSRVYLFPPNEGADDNSG